MQTLANYCCFSFIYFILLSLYHDFRSLTVEEDCGGDTDEANCTATNLILLDVFAVDSKSFTISVSSQKNWESNYRYVADNRIPMT